MKLGSAISMSMMMYTIAAAIVDRLLLKVTSTVAIVVIMIGSC